MMARQSRRLGAVDRRVSLPRMPISPAACRCGREDNGASAFRQCCRVLRLFGQIRPPTARCVVHTCRLLLNGHTGRNNALFTHRDGSQAFPCCESVLYCATIRAESCTAIRQGRRDVSGNSDGRALPSKVRRIKRVWLCPAPVRAGNWNCGSDCDRRDLRRFRGAGRELSFDASGDQQPSGSRRFRRRRVEHDRKHLGGCEYGVLVAEHGFYRQPAESGTRSTGWWRLDAGR